MVQRTLRTDRLVLVPLTDEHLELEVELEADPEVMRFLGPVTPRPQVLVAHRAVARRLSTVPAVHRSRLSTLLVDAPAADAPAASAFWSAALGVPARPVPGEEQFTSLDGALPGVELAVQAVDDTPRFHVDVETDDVDAETARLLALGAVETGRWLECRTLVAPGGHVLCVIPRHSPDEVFERLARTWP